MNWIKYEDQQPKDGQEIIAAEFDSTLQWSITTGSHYDDDNGCWLCGNDDRPIKISYWMPEEDLIATLPK